MNKRTSVNSLSQDERAAWRRHNLQTLAESAALPSEEKLAILEDLEELASIRAYDTAKASGDEVVPFEQALQEIQRSRR